MLSFIISAIAGCGIGFIVAKDQNELWGTVSGVIVFLIVQLITGLILRKFINKEQEAVQGILMQAQNDINRQITLFQRRSPGSERAAMQILEKIQNKAARDALEATENFKKFYIWNFMLSRQINTMKMQLFFQLKDYKAVDEIMPKCMLMDQQSLAIKLVRMYKNNDAGLDKFYRKKCARTKGDAAAFLASVYAWMLLKQDRSKEAVDILLKAKDKSDHPVVNENVERLVNGKLKQYTNAGFGDLWYALGLEEMKVKAQRQKMPRPF
ncbi:MAG: hypothetical protein IKC65_03000 [Lentisphaeria bacterium]|nr:hypothetical protein [Lentisphaeria bacterium]